MVFLLQYCLLFFLFLLHRLLLFPRQQISRVLLQSAIVLFALVLRSHIALIVYILYRDAKVDLHLLSLNLLRLLLLLAFFGEKTLVDRALHPPLYVVVDLVDALHFQSGSLVLDWRNVADEY